ncbi:hypothetical protein CCACVL1_22885 [Corchorus capsularis]|uniref:Uncharacterized protein n=1 Tax=Corchorus capsularis TaxID=210143 RepID=A0A1R3GW61_COCAP|nr:hypothetical protein CCACVL1_22885 [Corchorus capsularis]
MDHHRVAVHNPRTPRATKCHYAPTKSMKGKPGVALQSSTVRTVALPATEPTVKPIAKGSATPATEPSTTPAAVTPYGHNYLFTGSRDGTLKRWALGEDAATCSATFESHVDWVNDAVIAGDHTLVSCLSDTTLKTWNCLSNGTCTRTLRQHSDYVTCLAAAEKNANVVASGGLVGEVSVWDIEAIVTPLSKSSDATEDDCSNGINGSANSFTNIKFANHWLE